MAAPMNDRKMKINNYFPQITHVIFDMDGLLLDTETLYTKATQTILDDYNKQFTWEVKAKCMGRKALEGAKIMIDEYNLPMTPEEYLEKGRVLYKKIFPSAELMPGAEKLIRHLHRHKIPIAVATSANEENYNLETQNHQQLFSLFDHIVLISSDPSVKRGKPAPDGFIHCAKKFKDQPDHKNILVFEDAGNGVMAAVNAGMPVVWIPCHQADLTEYQDKATLTLKTMEDFKPELFGLPAYNS